MTVQAFPHRNKLTGWFVFIAILIAIGYAGNAAGTKPDADVLYQYDTAIGGGIVYLLMAGVILLIARGSHDLLALRRPTMTWPKALGLATALFVAAMVIDSGLEQVLHAGSEQGLIPTRWDSGHAAAYVCNWIVIAGVAPLVEEVTFRGLGYSLLSPRLGMWPTVVLTGALFAASHGLIRALPELMVLGCALAWLRARTDSVLPGIAVHAAFNSVALASVFF